MTDIKIPDIKGLHELTPLELNRQRFAVSHTILMPGLLVQAPVTVPTNTPLKK